MTFEFSDIGFPQRHIKKEEKEEAIMCVPYNHFYAVSTFWFKKKKS